MLPVYSYMGSPPQQRNQMHFSPNYCPTCPVSPPQMGYEWRPYGGNCGHLIPADCHARCNHDCFPGYYSFPPCHQMPPPFAFHWHGNHPMYPEPYPVQYAPPSYYPMKQPEREYERNDSGKHHCCGCPNHGPNRKGGNHAKIEEQEADKEKKWNSSDAAGVKDCPYPVVWIPPGYMKNGEHSAHVQQDTKEWNEDKHESNDAKSPQSFSKSVELQPGVWSSLFSPDSNNFRPLKQSGEGKRDRQSGDKNAQFSFPIIWMPLLDKMEQGETENNSAPKNFKVIPVKLSDIDDGGNKPGASEDNSRGQGGLKIVEKNAAPENIPVKERATYGEKHTSENNEGKSDGGSMKHEEDDGKKKPSDSTKGQPSSSPKTAKLPPVCLRVDPLPRKKHGNGNSRYPSPPGQRDESQETSNDTSKAYIGSAGLEGNTEEKTIMKSSTSEPNKKEIKVMEVKEKPDGRNEDKDSNSGSQEENAINKSSTLEPKEKEIKVVEVKEKMAGQNKDKDSNFGSEGQIAAANLKHREVPDEPIIEKSQAVGGENKAGEEGGWNAKGMISEESIEVQKAKDKNQSDNCECKIGGDKAGREVDEKKSDESPKADQKMLSDSEAAVKAVNEMVEKKSDESAKAKQNTLSNSEAAVIIQSAYRGFEVRKWESLKKLKQLAKLCDEAAEVRNHIQVLESSHLQGDNRQRMIIGETIMNLLLKLDAIQGLHPSLRDTRKSLARELVSLQDKLDSLMNKKPEVSLDEESIAKPVENLTNKDAIEGLLGNSDKTSCVAEASQSHPETDETADFGSEPVSVDREVQVESDTDTIGLQERSFVEPHSAEIEPLMESKDEQGNGSLDVSQAALTELQKQNCEPNSGSGLDEMTVELLEVGNEKAIYEMELAETPSENTIDCSEAASKTEVEDATPTLGDEGHPEMNELAELPVGVVEEATDMPADPNVEDGDEKLEVGKDEVREGDELDCNVKIDVKDEEQEISELAELPQLVAEEEPAMPPVSESTNDEKIEPGEDEVSEEAQDTNQSEHHLSEADMEDPQPQLQKESFPAEQDETGHYHDTEKVPETEEEGCNKEPVGRNLEPEELEATIGNQPKGSEAAKEEAINDQVVIQETGMGPEEKLIEENKKLTEMMEKLMNAGKEQLTVISNLTQRVKDLERKLWRKKKLRTRRHRAGARSSPISVKA